jgi:aspartyl/glutamyl-tRNA(Asn/Gln) amidotransferase C subunit
VDSESLRRLCELARLSLSADERAAFSAKFDSMLSFVEQVQEYKPAGPAIRGESQARLSLRLDQPRSFEWPMAPRLLKVPAIIDFESGGED